MFHSYINYSGVHIFSEFSNFLQNVLQKVLLGSKKRYRRISILSHGIIQGLNRIKFWDELFCCEPVVPVQIRFDTYYRNLQLSRFLLSVILANLYTYYILMLKKNHSFLFGKKGPQNEGQKKQQKKMGIYYLPRRNYIPAPA